MLLCKLKGVVDSVMAFSTAYRQHMVVQCYCDSGRKNILYS